MAEALEAQGTEDELDGQQLRPDQREWPRPWMPEFLRALAIIPDVSGAARVAGIGRQATYKAREKVPGFAEAWDEALELARDGVERIAHQWITTGVPIRSVRRRTVRKGDAVISEETIETESAERSATLMIFWLKAHHPERYRWAERVESSGPEGGPIRVESLDALDRQIEKLAGELAARDAPDA